MKEEKGLLLPAIWTIGQYMAKLSEYIFDEE